MLLPVLFLCLPLLTLAQSPSSAPTSASVLAAMNSSRSALSVAPLAEDVALARIAQQKAEDMAARSYFSHATPEGRNPWWWFTRAGYAYQRAGENLALNFSDAASLESAWMASPAHRGNIVSPNFTHTGIGIATGTYKGNKATFIVALYAKPAPKGSLVHIKARASAL